MNNEKKMTVAQARRTFKKYLKWNNGEIDEWDKKNRLPPLKTLRRMFATIGDALEIVDKLKLGDFGVLDPNTAQLTKYEKGRRIIEIVDKNTKGFKTW